MEQAQFGVLEMDWFIACVHAPAGGAHVLLLANPVNQCASAFFGQPRLWNPKSAPLNEEFLGWLTLNFQLVSLRGSRWRCLWHRHRVRKCIRGCRLGTTEGQ